MANLSRERRAATASYIESLVDGFVVLGRQIDCDFLVYLLEMAKSEAAGVKDGIATPVLVPAGVPDEEDDASAEELAAQFMRQWIQNS
jgi:hypothetical protein